ncbi:SNF2 family N-terminal domain-containing protein [Crucibulum laeve]|uniref:DNA helicase n=1 Tax=Crucibulum laeve TaxID=68775 RepID=A0A5C3MH59_9AGAR|nr:SNF2 family N-terminal domain-containing protein [Crucibulum laeve]
MYSSTEAATASNKKAALEQLKFNKSRNVNRTNNPSSTSSAPERQDHPSYALPPQQSRDGTVPSRYFPSTPSALGTVLVPSSSPMAPEDPPHPYQPYPQHRTHDVASIPGIHPSNSWGQPRSMFESDPLSAPSTFISSTVNNASLRRQWGDDDLYGGALHEEGPPRKRLNRGPSNDARIIFDSPGSPDIRHVAQRRRVPSSDVMSLSSDDSLPDASRIFAEPSRPRISRNRPSPSPDTPVSVDLSDKKFMRFKLTMPMESPARVEAAWIQAAGDVKVASAFLSDGSWLPTTPTSIKSRKDVKESAKDVEEAGRVRELEEASRAQRAAAKEKGKRSMIYANRSTLAENKPMSVATPPPSVKDTVDLTAVSPATPLPPRRKRAKKMVVDSDSEAEFVESGDEGTSHKRNRLEVTHETRALEYFNTTSSEALQELTGCTLEQADAIVNLRPFDSVDDLNTKLGQGRKKAGPAGISPKMFEECKNIFQGYGTVDTILEDCEQIGATLRAAIATWTTTSSIGKGKTKEDRFTELPDADDGALSLRSLAPLKQQKPKDYLEQQPSLLSKTVQLKEYQLLGVNWLNLLYRSQLSCILADEMGLGKTIQVISFLAYLKERGNTGPHLIVVPSSTLENWCREFARFAPSISVQTYYAGKDERPMLRQTLLDTQRSKSKTGEGWEVLITTYNLAQGDGYDRKFFRRVDWNCCIYDEGHVLKNFQSQRYQSLLKFGSNWRLLLTGTPLQNNLQELVSLMNFILPDQFEESITSLRAIFKVKGDSKVSLLSQERVSRAKKMMTPFVLRRRKDQVLKDLPKKTERIEWCEMTNLQQSIYTDALQRSRKTVFDVAESSSLDVDAPQTNGKAKPSKKKTKATARPKDKMYLENSSNVLMDLRKAASHPMLFRTRFTDDILAGITKQLLKEPDFKKRGALFDLVKEDMSVMTDAELQLFCASYKSTRKYLQDEEYYLEAGKVKVLLKLLDDYREQGRKVLIFSQFTQILDILQAILKHKKVQYLLLTGSTPVDVRQTLVDEFTEDDSIPVFLLSTKAGGMGINLTAASVVIMFDQDFNPHNDRQAQDRAYRIGQKRDVEVVKLISRGTIEEDMLRLGETKLALDEAVAGDADEKGESAPEREMKTSLMNVLRQQFEKQRDKGEEVPKG